MDRNIVAKVDARSGTRFHLPYMVRSDVEDVVLVTAERIIAGLCDAGEFAEEVSRTTQFLQTLAGLLNPARNPGLRRTGRKGYRDR